MTLTKLALANPVAEVIAGIVNGLMLFGAIEQQAPLLGDPP